MWRNVKLWTLVFIYKTGELHIYVVSFILIYAWVAEGPGVARGKKKFEKKFEYKKIRIF